MHDAFDFYERIRDEKGIRKAVRWASEIGDAMVLHRAEKVLPGSVSEEDWRRLADSASAKGMWAAALRAAEAVHDEPLARKAAAEILASGQPELVERYAEPASEAKEEEKPAES